MQVSVNAQNVKLRFAISESVSLTNADVATVSKVLLMPSRAITTLRYDPRALPPIP
jgi:hypothetical protein